MDRRQHRAFCILDRRRLSGLTPARLALVRPFTTGRFSMSHRFGCAEIALIGALTAISAGAAAQTPQPGYYDIPAGFDFPANKQTLEGYRTSGNLSAQRVHVWNVFAGMTQST